MRRNSQLGTKSLNSRRIRKLRLENQELKGSWTAGDISKRNCSLTGCLAFPGSDETTASHCNGEGEVA
jgi:hypothetical protein